MKNALLPTLTLLLLTFTLGGCLTEEHHTHSHPHDKGDDHSKNTHIATGDLLPSEFNKYKGQDKNPPLCMTFEREEQDGFPLVSINDNMKVEVPCDRVPNIDTQSGGLIKFKGQSVGDAVLELRAFDQTEPLRIVNWVSTLNGVAQNDLPLSVGVQYINILATDYRFEAANEPCAARVTVEFSWNNQQSARHPHHLVYFLQDHSPDRHEPVYNTSQFEANQETDSPSPQRCNSALHTLDYFKCIDGLTTHIAQHVLIRTISGNCNN